MTTAQRGGARRGAGRPPMAASDRSTVRLPIRMTARERADLGAWAEREGQPVAVLVLDRALRAARR